LLENQILFAKFKKSFQVFSKNIFHFINRHSHNIIEIELKKILLHSDFTSFFNQKSMKTFSRLFP